MNASGVAVTGLLRPDVISDVPPVWPSASGYKHVSRWRALEGAGLAQRHECQEAEVRIRDPLGKAAYHFGGSLSVPTHMAAAL